MCYDTRTDEISYTQTEPSHNPLFYDILIPVLIKHSWMDGWMDG